MNKRWSHLLVFAVVFLSLQAAAQGTQIRSPFSKKAEHPVKKPFFLSGGELIFSFGLLEAENYEVDNKLRFSIFPHLQEHVHYNFSNTVGVFSGISLINMGFINEFTLPDSRTFELRQRALALGVPLAIKFGNMESGNYVAIGGAAEFMTQYKTKFYFNDEKVKDGDWFADEVNIFNPAIFLDIRNKTGFYLRFKYYFNDFLKPVPSYFGVPISSEMFTVVPTQSPMFYVSFGSTFMRKKNPKKMTKEEV